MCVCTGGAGACTRRRGKRLKKLARTLDGPQAMAAVTRIKRTSLAVIGWVLGCLIVTAESQTSPAASLSDVHDQTDKQHFQPMGKQYTEPTPMTANITFSGQ